MPFSDDSELNLDMNRDGDDAAPTTVRSIDMVGSDDALWGDRPYEMPIVVE